MKAEALQQRILDDDVRLAKACPVATRKALEHFRPKEEPNPEYTTTPNLHLQVPTKGAMSWGENLDYDLYFIDWVLDVCMKEQRQIPLTR